MLFGHQQEASGVLSKLDWPSHTLLPSSPLADHLSKERWVKGVIVIVLTASRHSTVPSLNRWTDEETDVPILSNTVRLYLTRHNGALPSDQIDQWVSEWAGRTEFLLFFSFLFFSLVHRVFLRANLLPGTWQKKTRTEPRIAMETSSPVSLTSSLAGHASKPLPLRLQVGHSDNIVLQIQFLIFKL